MVSSPKRSLVRSTIPTDHLAQLVFLRKLSAQGLEVGDKSLACVEHCLLGCDLTLSLDTELEGGKERVGNCASPVSACNVSGSRNEGLRTLVSGEHDLGILEELCAKHVGQSVVLLVEGEDGAVGCAYESELGMIASDGRVWRCVRVSATSVHFFSPSPRRKSSNLSNNQSLVNKGFPPRIPYLPISIK